VPDFTECNQDPGVNRFLKQYGLKYEEVPYDRANPPVGVHTILGVSPRGGMHCVVGKDGKIVWDPHPQDGTGRGLAKPTGYGLLLPIKNRLEKLYQRQLNLRPTKDSVTLHPDKDGCYELHYAQDAVVDPAEVWRRYGQVERKSLLRGADLYKWQDLAVEEWTALPPKVRILLENEMNYDLAMGRGKDFIDRDPALWDERSCKNCGKRVIYAGKERGWVHRYPDDQAKCTHAEAKDAFEGGPGTTNSVSNLWYDVRPNEREEVLVGNGISASQARNWSGEGWMKLPSHVQAAWRAAKVSKAKDASPRRARLHKALDRVLDSARGRAKDAVGKWSPSGDMHAYEVNGKLLGLVEDDEGVFMASTARSSATPTRHGYAKEFKTLSAAKQYVEQKVATLK